MPKPRINALTLRAAGNVRAFECDVRVSEAFDPNLGLQHPPMLQYRGIWDTGASGSVITAKVVADLGLRAIDRTVAKTANGVSSTSSCRAMSGSRRCASQMGTSPAWTF